MKKLVIGILAHVDAGKTTLSEAMLFASGRIKTLGRVDHRNTFLDTNELERERGITIFSKQAVLQYGDTEMILMDTPGHVDFSTEAERTLQVLDCAVLVISGTDGVQPHTETLWRLLRRYNVPTFIFVTKMDLAGSDRENVCLQLRRQLSEGCVSFSPKYDDEELAMCDEILLEKYMSGSICAADISSAIARRSLFPCYFGSGLKVLGVEELLRGLSLYGPRPSYSADFGARIFKIMRDPQGRRLTCMKITGGEIHVRDSIKYTDRQGNELEEKLSQIRIYSGDKFESTENLGAGSICAVTGLSCTWPGQGLGIEPPSAAPVLEPVLTYKLALPEGVDPMSAMPKLLQLEEEDPQLHIVWNSQLREIHVQLMGQVQIEVLRRLIKERFDMDVEIDAGRIMYRETIAGQTEGVGHYEPLRHYAEVHLLIEQGETGSGIALASICPEDELDRNWQRLILTHLAEKQHLGVLTGSPLTDVKITLVSGRAHLKHTEGGDFRQATYRAVRQGLMSAESILLEPYYEFTLQVPPDQLGRAINDIRAMSGEFSTDDRAGELAVIHGCAPVSEMREYAAQVASYTRGKGRFTCRTAGYRPCHNSAQVIAELGYDPERDLENSPDSVFCAHGAGFTVKWDKVHEYMHLDSFLAPKPTSKIHRLPTLDIDERELEAIMEREFGPIKRPQYTSAKGIQSTYEIKSASKREFIIVDGYNVIFAWDELSALAADDLDTARHRLMDILSNYRGFTNCRLALVFDAYKVTGGSGSKFDYHGINVVYTKDGETGDAYIEKLSHDIGKNYSVRVVTSDGLIQLSALRAGVLRVSANEFEKEVDWVYSQIESVLRTSNSGAHTRRITAEEVKNGKR